MFHSGPIRPGTRGGQGDFTWAEVGGDKDRENYLGHSINAPTGRWQKNKDIHWYNRDQQQSEDDKREELRKIKEAEEDALAIALGFAPAVRKGADDEPSSTANAVPVTGNKMAGTIDLAARAEKDKHKEEKRRLKEEKRTAKEDRRVRKEREREERHAHARDHDRHVHSHSRRSDYDDPSRSSRRRYSPDDRSPRRSRSRSPIRRLRAPSRSRSRSPPPPSRRFDDTPPRRR